MLYHKIYHKWIKYKLLRAMVKYNVRMAKTVGTLIRLYIRSDQ